ncbi:MAG: hypothetical protein JXB30_17275 [Anaerolineae bacterium]|nr:hypothetical protein [Anaerolineae bacterium]
MKRFIFWQRWLLVLSIVIIIFGLVMSLLSSTAVFDLLNNQVNPVFWNAQPIPEQALAFRSWIYGVTGAAMAGWGVFFAFLAHYPFRRREKWAWTCILLGVLIWYVPDTIISLASGVVFNAIFNTSLLAAVALPLLMTYKDFMSE